MRAARHALVACLGVGSPARPDGHCAAGPRLTVRWTGADTAAFGPSAIAERCDTLHLIEIRAISGDTGLGLALYDSGTMRSRGATRSGLRPAADRARAGGGACRPLVLQDGGAGLPG